MEGLRRVYGLGEPIRRGMELRIAGAGEWRPSVLGGSASVHSDVLNGRDTEVSWEDVFKGESVLGCFESPESGDWRWVLVRWVLMYGVLVGNDLREQPDFHTEMEAKMKMNHS